MGMFVRFCQFHGLLEEVELPAFALKKGVSTLRTAVANPDLADHTWRSLVGQANPSQINQQYALAFALGYYAGLRASKVCQLTLADVRIEQKMARTGQSSIIATRWGQPRLVQPAYCRLAIARVIRESKTSAARRRVPLHLLAPPDVTERMSLWWDTRRAVAYRTSLREVALFVPLFSARAYTPKG